ncbi:MAG TPA: AraC family transcriptional regulator [Vicinamibacterales bacterium]|nr:AraC family transcriptional regulator [Vicinamibacterales bacterium]
MARRFEPVSLGSPTFTNVEVGAFQITRARFPAGLVLPAHVHERACVATTLSGAWESVLGRQSHTCRPSTLLVEPAGDRHSNHFTGTTDVLVIQPDGSREDFFRPCRKLLDEAQSFVDPAIGLVARRLAGELTGRDEVAPLVVEGLALELVATAVRGGNGSTLTRDQPRWLRRARERLHDGAVAGVSIGDVAAEAGVHPVHLARVFRACYGTSPGSYARRVRLDRAAARLVSSDEPIAVIAQDAGFADQSHFTRAFRRHTGWTPAAFRRRMRG